ncbi:hypothetical protein KQ874_02820 [Mycoplasma sp. ES3157-GEN-MYC]|uniref:Uncharacterized protein n=1 Tax=Mycoplasma miroungigenitalium TaxID=754515 RepID=A0A6M4JBI0_9MOLU|nr:hypothetical protein [Mycoplasma miroungigenitalium]MBU4690611.1 hypothetical protein [Mycoplasma miroungigenitalium]MBU4691878.1 hypothetical protein [Mycoplasma miroungigenitalium]QJR43735.1 hypothetical protein HLA87_03020 [Mycoplasma miroungigenitalium]
MNNYYVPITDENKRFYMGDGKANFVMNSSGELMFIIENKILKVKIWKENNWQITNYFAKDII